MPFAKYLRAGLMLSLAACGWVAATAAVKADDLFVVIGVDPLTPEIEAGSVYQSQQGQSEFIYVPQGVQIALISENGQRYLIAGRNAVLADTQSLSEFEIERIESAEPGFLSRLFGIGLPTEFVAATRRFGAEDLKVSPGSVADLSTIFVDLLGETNDTPTFCLFSDTATMRRSDGAGTIPLTLAIGSDEVSGSWRHGEKDLALSGLSLPPGEAVEANLKKGLSERKLRLRRLAASTLEKGMLSTIATLARNDCTIQAMLLSNAVKR